MLGQCQHERKEWLEVSVNNSGDVVEGCRCRDNLKMPVFL